METVYYKINVIQVHLRTHFIFRQNEDLFFCEKSKQNFQNSWTKLSLLQVNYSRYLCMNEFYLLCIHEYVRPVDTNLQLVLWMALTDLSIKSFSKTQSTCRLQVLPTRKDPPPTWEWSGKVCVQFREVKERSQEVAESSTESFSAVNSCFWTYINSSSKHCMRDCPKMWSIIVEHGIYFTCCLSFSPPSTVNLRNPVNM